MTQQSNFSPTGLPIGNGDVNMMYLYGLSDFFDVMFKDTGVPNLLIQANNQSAAEIYSNFLQLTSTISLAGIEETVGSSIIPIFISSTDAVAGAVNTYTIDSQTVLSSTYIANKPLLPTLMIEQNVDFVLTSSATGVTTIQFAQPITSYSFSARSMPDGSIQYALWFVDVEIDEQWVYKCFGSLIGVDPQNSTDAYYNFVYGLFYVYVQGPTLDVLRKGLNLVLGIPIARANETVIDIRMYLNTDQYIVFTDQNSYLIPYGIAPSVTVGQVLSTGDELALWIDIQDYNSDGDWWLNLQIPTTIIPGIPDGQKDRFATEGSHFDYLMRNYLKKHTFLVNVNVSSFENLQTFAQISSIIGRAKPTYTQPIYVWTVTALSETLTVDDSNFTMNLSVSRCENLGYPIHRFYRNNTLDPLPRSCPTFTRYDVPNYVSKICGTDTYINGDPTSMTLNGATVSGLTDNVVQWRTNTEAEVAWLNAIIWRNSDVWRGPRTQVGFYKNLTYTGSEGQSVNISSSSWGTPAGLRVIPLYATTWADILTKSASLGVASPDPNAWSFPLFGAGLGSYAINAIGIDAGPIQTNSTILQENFNLLFYRSANVGYLSINYPDVWGWTTYAPGPTDIQSTDYLLGVRIVDNVVGVYWVTTNFTVDAPSYTVVPESDPLVITYNMPLTRNGGQNGCPWYALRGKGTLNYTNLNAAINAAAINADTWGLPMIAQSYVDKYNPNMLYFTRGGTNTLIHAVEQS